VFEHTVQVSGGKGSGPESRLHIVGTEVAPSRDLLEVGKLLVLEEGLKIGLVDVVHVAATAD
jgi:hypothetical protein